MEYISTRGGERTSFRQALLQGLAGDGGLFMPERIPSREWEELISYRDRPYHELASFLLAPYVEEAIPGDRLEELCRDAFSFEVPLLNLYENVFCLELFHGPTLAFKDFGARFLARCLGYFSEEEDKQTLVLVATSGDTGSAVAQGFYRIPGIGVVVLYPAGKVSPLQEKQFATLGENILALAVDGSFDDCQDLVKACLQDPGLSGSYRVTTANSINLGRLLPQMVYYIHAWLRLPAPDMPFVISVPSGNFGNLTAGLMAMFSGMPVNQFIASTNVNRVFPDYLDTAEYLPRTSLPTLANAMDVGNPNNVERIMALFSWDHAAISRMIRGTSVDSDDAIREAIRELYDRCGYIADPHGAIAWEGLKAWTALNANLQGIFLGTAHPAKFIHPGEDELPVPEQPDGLRELSGKRLLSVPVQANTGDVLAAIRRWLSEAGH